jgi:hypothetical protein
MGFSDKRNTHGTSWLLAIFGGLIFFFTPVQEFQHKAQSHPVPFFRK